MHKCAKNNKIQVTSGPKWLWPFHRLFKTKRWKSAQLMERLIDSYVDPVEIQKTLFDAAIYGAGWMKTDHESGKMRRVDHACMKRKIEEMYSVPIA